MTTTDYDDLADEKRFFLELMHLLIAFLIKCLMADAKFIRAAIDLYNDFYLKHFF